MILQTRTSSRGSSKRRRIRVPIHAAQSAFRRASEWIRGFIGGRGSGKTVIGCLDLLMRAEAGGSYMVVAPTYAMLHEATWPTFLEWAGKLGRLVRTKLTPFPRAVVCLTSNRQRLLVRR